MERRIIVSWVSVLLKTIIDSLYNSHLLTTEITSRQQTHYQSFPNFYLIKLGMIDEVTEAEEADTVKEDTPTAVEVN